MNEEKKKISSPDALRFQNGPIVNAPSYWLEPCVSIQHPDWMIPLCFARGSLLRDPIEVEQARANWQEAVTLGCKTDWETAKLVEVVLPQLHGILTKGMLEAKRVGWRTTHTIRFRNLEVFEDVQALAQVFTERDVNIYSAILKACREYKKTHPECKQPFQSMTWTREQWTVLGKLGFVPIPPEEIKTHMQKFADELQAQLKKIGQDPLEGMKLAVWAHHQLSAIMPFAWEGNGRLARLVSGCLLMRFGFLPPVHHPKSEYIHAVGCGNHDFKYLLLYFTDQIRQVHKWLVDSKQLLTREAYMEKVEQILDTPIVPAPIKKGTRRKAAPVPTLDDVAHTVQHIELRRSERIRGKMYGIRTSHTVRETSSASATVETSQKK
jgi:hypothetical protein